LHGDPAATPFSNYFANLVVSEQHLRTGELPCSSRELARHIKPCGGVLCLAVPQAAGVAAATDRWQTTRETVTRVRQQINCDVEQSDALLTLVRGKPPGAGDWTHQYGDAANTMMSKDELVRGDLGVLWYGDPGPAKMVNRHDAAAAPLSTNGRMFIQGYKSVMAYDAFNGVFLWERENPGAVRTGVFRNEDTANLAASEDFLFVVVDDKCSVLDAATGDIVAEYKTEAESSDDVKRVWGYVAHWNGMLFGTSTVRSELDRSLRRRGLQVKKATDAIFAINLKTGKRQWTYRGGNIEHVTIAIGDDRVFFIDSSISPEERQTLLRQDKSDLQNLSPEEAAKKEAELKSLDVRLAVALDASTGEKLWSQAVDVTDCSEIGIGGGKLTLMYHDGHVVLGGANANGHYWRQFLSGQFNRRRLVVLDANHGDLLWSKDANYRHRPIIVGDEIIAEPWGFDLHTGKQKTRENPVTGEETAWQFSRPGHHCGPITATPNMLVFRSGFTAYYDLYGDSGTSHFAGQRPGCWVNAIPGNGLLMVPEASAGCVCLFSLAATVVMEPRTDHDTWRIYSATGGSTPVRHLAINFGAPGDRKDAQGTLWLAYPRPRLVGRLEYDLKLKCQHQSSGGYFQQNDQLVEVDSAETPWVFTSGLQQATRCEIPLLGKDDDPAEYRVKLLFTVAPEQHEHAGNARILIQGQPQTVAASAAEDGNYRSQEYQGISVQDRLVIEFSAADPADSASLPTLAGVEITRE
jgi:outer membrane protein assembly factor BamB